METHEQTAKECRMAHITQPLEDDMSLKNPPLKASDEDEADALWSMFSLDPEDPILNDPFARCSDEEARLIAQSCAHEYRLDDQTDLFMKAATILCNRDSTPWRNFDDAPLNAEETAALRNEGKASFWDQPWPLRTTFLMLFVAAMVQGWSQTGTSGANLGFPESSGWNAHSTVSNTSSSGRLDHSHRGFISPSNHVWRLAAIDAVPYLVAAQACWIAEPLNDLMQGRRGATAVSAFVIFLSSIGAAFTDTYVGLFLWRALLGVGMGCQAAIVPVFAVEIAPAHLRGALVSNWQTFDALGVFFGFTANIIASRAGSTAAWRWQVASLCISSFALFWGILFITWDSPRFLIKNEKNKKAAYDRAVHLWKQQTQDQRNDHGIVIPISIYGSRFLPSSLRRFFRPNIKHRYKSPTFETLVLLRGHPILAAKELLHTHCRLLVEGPRYKTQSVPANPHEGIQFTQFGLKPGKNWLAKVGHLIAPTNSSYAYIRRGAVAAVTLMLGQQLCGFNVLQFYSAVLFHGAEDGKESSSLPKSLLLSWAIGAFNFMFALPAYKWIESRGRRWLLLVTLPLLAIIMVVAALFFELGSDDGQDMVVFTFAILFTAVYSSGLGPIPFAYSAEVFPLEHRMVGMSLAVSVNMLGLGALGLLVPHVPSPRTLLAIFSGLNLLAFCGVWRYVREIGETSDPRKRDTVQSLEQLSCVFDIPNWLYEQYQSEVFFDYFWRSIWSTIACRKMPCLDETFYDWSCARCWPSRPDTPEKESLRSGWNNLVSTAPIDKKHVTLPASMRAGTFHVTRDQGVRPSISVDEDGSTGEMPPRLRTAVSTCACGKVIEDTYEEYIPGTVLTSLGKIRRHHRRRPVSRRTSARDFIRQCRMSIQEKLTCFTGAVFPYFTNIRRGDDNDGSIRRATRSAGELESHGSTDDRYIFVCFSRWGRYYRTKMTPVCMDMDSDEEFFKMLKARFNEECGRWRRALGFKRVTDIRFVKFQFTGHPLVEVCLHSGMPDRPKEILPPLSYSEYEFWPRPMTMYPPVGHNRLMHFYECPHACEESKSCISRLPKHSTGQLEVSQDTQEDFGWGIELVEGLDWAYCWIYGLMVLIAASVFGTVWARKTGSIQDGFTMATYVVTAFAFIAASAQVAFDRVCSN